MDFTGNPRELALLRTFTPFDGMKPEGMGVFARKITRRQAPKGRLLFTPGVMVTSVPFLLASSGKAERRLERETLIENTRRRAFRG